VFKNFVSSISTQRKQRSLAWIESIEANMSDIDKMSVGEANRLLSKAVNPPAILTDEHTIRLSKVVNRIEEHLESLTLEWLIEKFKELPKTAQKKFIEKISEVVNGLCQ